MGKLTPYTQLGRGGQTRRMMRLARVALSQYAVPVARVTRLAQLLQ